MSEEKNSVQQFGQELVNAREFKKMTLEQIADITKISIHYLEAMEEGSWEVLPRPYMEVFLKAYAEAVGMNVPKVMKKYREMVVGDTYPESPSEQPVDENGYIPSGEKNLLDAFMSPRTLFIGVAVILLVVVVAVYFIFLKPSGDRTPDITGTPPDRQEMVEDSTSSAQTALSQADDTADQNIVSQGNLTQSRRQTSEKFTLRARAHERCWLAATVDQQNVRDVLLRADEQLTLEANEEIHLVIGNAGGLDLELEGEMLDSLGPNNRPVTLVIGPEGIISQRLGAWHLNYQSQMQNVPSDTLRE